MEKIYSRKIIRIPKIKKMSKIRVFVFILIFTFFLIIMFLVFAVYPIFEGSCKNKAGSIAISITSSEVNKVISNYQYEDLIRIEKNVNGDISMIMANIIPINEMVSKITANIKNQIDIREQTVVELNMGTITGISILSSIGPKFKIKLECSGNVKTNLESEFSSARYKSDIT